MICLNSDTEGSTKMFSTTLLTSAQAKRMFKQHYHHGKDIYPDHGIKVEENRTRKTILLPTLTDPKNEKKFTYFTKTS